MKIVIFLLALVLPLAAQTAATPRAKRVTKPVKTATKAKKAEPAQPSGLPKDAKKLSEMEWRWVDPKGAAWIYRRTPVGYAKIPEAETIKPAAPVSVNLFQAADKGDSVEFTTRTPVGISRWTKKKTDLSPDEKASWEAAQSAKPPTEQ